MKIGILTFHRAENFGAALQVFALSELLKLMGHEPTVIDYRCFAIERTYDILNPYILISKRNIFRNSILYFKRLLNAKSLYTKKRVFKEFREKYLNVTDPVTNIHKDLGFDAYIVGSDQVWRIGLTGGVDNVYFLNFPMRPIAKKISYAASSEVNAFKQLRNNKEQIRLLLEKFDYISVREKELAEELSSYVDKEISICLDPTFLLDADFYINLAIKPETRGYILVYHLFNTKEGYELAKMLANTTGKHIIEVFAGDVVYFDNHRHMRISIFGPCEMLGLILYADMVITTSFHGLALSLKLNKDVWIMDIGANGRLKNILQMVGLSKRMIKNKSEFKKYDLIDYVIVNKKINQLINESKNFLIKSLG